MWKRLYHDEFGFVASTETILLGTVLMIGTIVGLTAVRDAVSAEFGDVANSIFRLQSTYSYAPIVSDCGTTAGSVFLDRRDFCAGRLNDNDPPGLSGPVYPGGQAAAEPE